MTPAEKISAHIATVRDRRDRMSEERIRVLAEGNTSYADMLGRAILECDIEIAGLEKRLAA
ncbi:hypothetical protein [Cereibacter johrii]|uniref:hypothetical protein n=1 Tax=Cereibacter johrii TaxID=445629 RepID=UPI000DCCE391|nr:hypothetical protein [Cereibacter johrii]RAZ83428.1 hypothetical protein DDV93_14050 [Cereibacter johrii]